MNECRIYLEEHEPKDLARHLKGNLPSENLYFEWKGEDQKGFSPEVASLLVSGLAALGPLVSAILVFLAQKKSPSIIIVKDSAGRIVQFSSNERDEQIRRLLEILENMERIQVTVKRASGHATEKGD